MVNRQQAEALIQEQLISTIQQDAPKQSIFMGMARKLPNMTSKQTRNSGVGNIACNIEINAMQQ